MSAARRAGPIWYGGPLADVPSPADRPLAWMLRLDDEQALRDAAAARLTANETASFSRTRDASWRMLRRRLAKALIARTAPCHPDRVRITRNTSGSLCVAAPGGWRLSLAGQAPHALIGLGRAPLGVDCEPRDAPAAPPDAFTPAERTVLHARWPGQPALALLAGWVAKEAHGKACGRARQLDPRRIELSDDGESLLARSAGACSVVWLAIGDETVAALAESA